MAKISVQNQKFPENHLIVQTIREMRNKGFSYGKIANRLCMAKTSVYEIDKGRWFPTRESTLHGILNAIVGLNK